MRTSHQEQELVLGNKYAETYVRLAKHRILFLCEEITDTMASELSALLLYLDHEDHDKPIELYLHSVGGSVPAMINIYDVMQMIDTPIKTVCLGKCYSAAAVLLSAGSKGYRFALKNSSIMIHGIQCGFPIPGHDMTNTKNYYDFLSENNDNVMKILSQHTHHSLERIKQDCKQDVFLTPKQALEYGIIDGIL